MDMQFDNILGVSAALSLIALLSFVSIRRSLSARPPTRRRAMASPVSRFDGGSMTQKKTHDGAFGHNSAASRSDAPAVIPIIHGIPGKPGLDVDDALRVVRLVRDVPKNRDIHIVLHTPGGLSFAAEMIAQALRDHGSKVVAFVPYYAMSAGTVIALATSEIVYGSAAALGPIDTQYYGFPVGAHLDLMKRKRPQFVDDRLIMMGFVAKKIKEDDEKVLCTLIHRKHGRGDPCAIAEYLASGVHDHGFRVTYDKARELKINVSRDMPHAYYELVDAELAGSDDDDHGGTPHHH